jgi:nicotinic acid mononucleotide adenylyltransferase
MLDDLITSIHAAQRPSVIEFAGAGSQALWWLHRIAGSSRTIVEATDRYSRSSMTQLLHYTPERFVSQQTAIDMAKAAYIRAVDLGATHHPIGISCTATIATDRIKKGDHGCWVACYDGTTISSYGLILQKGLRTRDAEESVISQLIIHVLALHTRVSDNIALALSTDEYLDVHHQTYTDYLADLLCGTQRVIHYDNHTFNQWHPTPAVILSGSFNPLHDGHRALLHTASQLTGLPGFFELSVINADKPSLPYHTITGRAKQFTTPALLLTRAPRFIDKAQLMPGSTFVLGYDTAIRLLDRKYYVDGNIDDMFAHIAEAGCRFVVAGRRLEEQPFQLFDIASVPSTWRHLFETLDEATFRYDISSSQIRQGRFFPST